MKAQLYMGLPYETKMAFLNKKPCLDIDAFLDFYCNKEGVFVSDIMKGGRRREHVMARQWVWWAYRKYTVKNKVPSSLQKMGDRFNKDHATVLHGIRTMSNLVDVYSNTHAKKYLDYYFEIIGM